MGMWPEGADVPEKVDLLSLTLPIGYQIPVKHRIAVRPFRVPLQGKGASGRIIHTLKLSIRKIVLLSRVFLLASVTRHWPGRSESRNQRFILDMNPEP